MPPNQAAALAEMKVALGAIQAEIASLKQNYHNFRAEHAASQSRSADFSSRASIFENDVSRLEQDLRELLKIVRDGNGQPALILRAVQLEAKVSNQESLIRDLQARLDANATAKVMTRGQIWTGIAGVIVTVVLSVSAMLVQLLSGKGSN